MDSYHISRGRGRGGKDKYKTQGGKGRGGKARGGRGGFRGKYRGNSRNQKLESNEWRFEEDDTESSTKILRESTLENCTRNLPSPIAPPSSQFSFEIIMQISQILSNLSLEEQMEFDFLVPMPPLDNVDDSIPKADSGKEGEKPPTAAATGGETKRHGSNLDDWLNDLLG
ncbi:hypothetical protein TRFO_38975 [Tritrichomonas foetus]|uniref:Uncharacterized protein n=1 Tax=Tritrichomonas foetus TaxID=1144522 RepID=A0A1J4J6K8_9EUKA|nr:hypothetical protein TRFO_38975 [Tritrichomonas foetus]|eukprot:OHS94832.1 hypothetical protein TRFO_38975 [Tritrichomonas foetus]